MNVLFWIISGLIVGWIASINVNSNRTAIDPYKVILAVVGAVIGGWLALRIAKMSIATFELSTIVCAVAGSLLALSIYSYAKLKRAH